MIRRFAGFVGYKLLTDVTRREIVEFRDLNQRNGLSNLTASRKVAMLKTLFVTAINYELLDSNHADKIRAVGKPQIKQRVAFSAAELTAIFNSAIYSEGYPPKDAGYKRPIGCLCWHCLLGLVLRNLRNYWSATSIMLRGWGITSISPTRAGIRS